MKRLVLDRAHLTAMLGDSEFYRQCPHFLWLRESALQAHAEYKKQECCQGQTHMAQIIDAFFRNLRELHEVDPAIIQPIRAYLTARKKRTVDKIIIYYRSADGQPVQFAF